MAPITVEGMTCGGCAAAVRKAIASVAPAAHVEVDLASRQVRVDGDVDEQSIKAAICGAGYQVAG
ncbi:heavy-metal-associated domain-containing protein [Caulobacter sp. 17J65-9]|nr:heavy-metal-associated domain-containing protein [Caulobacter sp. 17J65-9]